MNQYSPAAEQIPGLSAPLAALMTLLAWDGLDVAVALVRQIGLRQNACGSASDTVFPVVLATEPLPNLHGGAADGVPVRQKDGLRINQ